jgi:hypothetical protein
MRRTGIEPELLGLVTLLGFLLTPKKLFVKK